jgi:hypothetical protein
MGRPGCWAVHYRRKTTGKQPPNAGNCVSGRRTERIGHQGSRVRRVAGRTDITASRSELFPHRIPVPAAPLIMEGRSSLGSAPSLPISRYLCPLSPIFLSISRVSLSLDISLSIPQVSPSISGSHSLYLSNSLCFSVFGREKKNREKKQRRKKMKKRREEENYKKIPTCRASSSLFFFFFFSFF